MIALNHLQQVGPLKGGGLDHCGQEADQGQLRIEHRLDLAQAHPVVTQKAADAVHRLLVELHRRQREVGGGERGDDPDVRIRVGVDHADVERVVDGTQEGPELAGEWRVQGRLALEAKERPIARNQHEGPLGQGGRGTGHQGIGRHGRDRDATGQAQGLGEVALVVEVDGQDAAAAMGEVMRQQRGHRALADAALLIAQNHCLHAWTPPLARVIPSTGAPTR